MSAMRLDKYVCLYTDLSRKEAKATIRKGLVTVEGQNQVHETDKISDQKVWVDGRLLVAKEHIYLMLNKPAGIVSATRDDRDTTVVDIIDCGKREMFPIGRLDKDTEGLLLLTDDGGLAHRLTSPRYHVPKCYLVQYEGTLVKNAGEILAEGIDIGEREKTLPAQWEELQDGLAKLTISEGKYHQVKRMIARLGGRVTRLRRLTMGPIALDHSLQPGAYRELSEKEVQLLREAAVK